MTLLRKFTLSVLPLVVGMVLVQPAFAACPGTTVTERIQCGLSGAAAGYGPQPAADQLPAIIGRLIGSALGLLGVVLLGYLLFGGYIWMTAGGDEKKVDKARAYIRNAIIGLVIIAAAYSIASYVVLLLSGAITGGTVTPTG